MIKYKNIKQKINNTYKNKVYIKNKFKYYGWFE